MTLHMDELAQTLFEEAGDGLYVFDPEDGHLLDVNPMAQRLTGYPRHELLCMSVKSLFSSEVAGGMVRLFAPIRAPDCSTPRKAFACAAPIRAAAFRST